MRWIVFLWLLGAALPAAALDKVSLQLNWKHQFQFAGYYAAIEKGYYRDAGFEVVPIEAGADASPVDAVLDGRADYGVGASELALRRGRGEPVIALATILQHSPLVLLARRDQSAPSIHDLAGKRLMLMPHETELYAYLKREGIERYRPLAHSFDAHDLIEGRTDAVSGYITDEPFVLQRAKFPYAAFSPRSSGIDFYGDTLFTTERLAQRRPDRVTAFRDASLRGWRYAMDHPEEMADLILAQYGRRHSREHLLYEAAEMRRLMQLQLVEIGHMLPGRWQHIAETYAELGMLPADFSIDGLVWRPTQPRPLPGWVLPGFLGALVCVLFAIVIILRFRRINALLAREVAERIEVEEALRAANAQLQVQVDETRRLQSALHEQALRDSLTGLFNRRHLDETLGREVARARHDGYPLALVMIDVDHFKRLNDTYGHQAGDVVLVALGQLLADATRADDIACRYGGEEFLVVLPRTTLAEAHDKAESWRMAFSSLGIPHGELTMRTTISLGIAGYPEHGHSADELTQSADLALYLSKHDGRNRTTVFETVPLILDACP